MLSEDDMIIETERLLKWNEHHHDNEQTVHGFYFSHAEIHDILKRQNLL